MYEVRSDWVNYSKLDSEVLILLYQWRLISLKWTLVRCFIQRTLPL